MINTTSISRRSVLKTGAGLTLALMGGSLITACAKKDPFTFKANAFVNVSNDGIVTVIARNAEIGQGVFTGLATIVAEELDADWSKVVVEAAPTDPKVYGNPGFFGMQGTGGSNSMSSSWDGMRQAGATARAMLVAAAAADWGVPAAEITIEKGVLKHAGKGKQAGLGEFAEAAAKLPVPEAATVALKDPKDYRLVGTDLPRLDAVAKSNGTAVYTQDVKLDGMVVALVIAPPKFGGKVKSFDATAAKAMPGVTDVVKFQTPVREGVAVLARDYWSAKQARDKVTVEWDDSTANQKGSDALLAEYKALAAKPGLEVKKQGSPGKGVARTLQADYEFPYLAHAAMEPLNCVVHITDGACEIWTGAQLQSLDQTATAARLGLKPEQVKINSLFAGGSFGRRSNPHSDFVIEAVAIAQAGGQGKPVKMVWSREEDTRGGFYRPAFYHSFKAGVDAQGKLVSWQHRLVGQSILEGTTLMPPMPFDPLSVEGAANLPYDIPNMLVDLHSPKSAVTVQWWRSVGSTHTAYSTEVFLDEVARATNQDPLALRQSLLAKHPRHLAVLQLAAEKAGWGTPLPEGMARGIAVHECFGSVVAEVAEVRKVAEGQFKVERIVAAAHVGRAINPNIVAMQVESSIGLGLGAAFTGAITLKDGVVEQSNFHDYPVLRMSQMPKVEVHIVPSQDKPTGIGEPGLPPAAAAVANAVAALTGKTLRVQPFSKEGITFV